MPLAALCGCRTDSAKLSTGAKQASLPSSNSHQCARGLLRIRATMRSFSAGHFAVSYCSAGLTSVRPSFDSSSAWNAGSTAAMPQAALDNAQPGDVLLCMGAGSIGAVSGKVVELLQKNELLTQVGRA